MHLLFRMKDVKNRNVRFDSTDFKPKTLKNNHTVRYADDLFHIKKQQKQSVWFLDWCRVISDTGTCGMTTTLKAAGGNVLRWCWVIVDQALAEWPQRELLLTDFRSKTCRMTTSWGLWERASTPRSSASWRSTARKGRYRYSVLDLSAVYWRWWVGPSLDRQVHKARLFLGLGLPLPIFFTLCLLTIASFTSCLRDRQKES